MAATDGDSANVVDSALGNIWNASDSRVELHAADISTGTGGAGSTTVNWNESFADSEVYAFATAQSDATAFVSSAGSSQATVEVSGGPASTTVTVNVLAAGTDPSA